ncbi:MAG: hypothetical protein AAGU74_14075 [Bacillota bacterium]
MRCCFDYVSVIDENLTELEKAQAVLSEALGPLEPICKPGSPEANHLIMQKEHIHLLLSVVADIIRNTIASSQKALDQYNESCEAKSEQGGDADG